MNNLDARSIASTVQLDTMLAHEDLAIMDELWHGFPAHRQSIRAERRRTRPSIAFSPDLVPRVDAVRNFRRTGGRFSRRPEPWPVLRARTTYFRDEYAYGNMVTARGIDRILADESLSEAAKTLYGCAVVVPYNAYGNLLLPGQELGLHTDVPAFRGADRSTLPLWMLVVMRHSGLFEKWRIPIATAVLFLGGCGGGEFVCYPEGASSPGVQIRPSVGRAVMLDADTVFHGVDRVLGDDSPMWSVGEGAMRLLNRGDRTWQLEVVDPVVAAGGPRYFDYCSDDLRFSLSWKAYCFREESERRCWSDHSDDLRVEAVIGALVDELYERGALTGRDHALSDAQLALLMIDTFIRFPASESASPIA
jgi:hypothetical protein